MPDLSRACGLTHLAAVSFTHARLANIGTEDSMAMAGKYDDPVRFAEAIAAFEDEDRGNTPPAGAIPSVGSSSLTRWNATIGQDLAPLTILARAFGGSTMPDLLHWMDRVVFPYRPRAILLYEGDNDTAAGATPPEVADNFATFFAAVDERLP